MLLNCRDGFFIGIFATITTLVNLIESLLFFSLYNLCFNLMKCGNSFNMFALQQSAVKTEEVCFYFFHQI